MKSKKSLFYFCMLALVAVAAFASAVLLSIARVPTVTEHEFNFSITYELNGEIISGLITEEHRQSWQNLSVEAMYEELSKELIKINSDIRVIF